MLGNFKLRMLLVIVIITVVGISFQYQNKAKRFIEPVIGYILKDQGLEKDIALFVNSWVKVKEEGLLPRVEGQSYQIPCEFSKIECNYGWHWNEEENQEEFYPGIKLKVEKNSIVMPVAGGQVLEISGNDEGQTLLIKHESFYSLYTLLKEVLVIEDEIVEKDTAIARTGSSLYFELRNRDGPLNPNFLFEQQ